MYTSELNTLQSHLYAAQGFAKCPVWCIKNILQNHGGVVRRDGLYEHSTVLVIILTKSSFYM